ncbi:hypothetical protein MKEN_01236700 [Mycena kentingensis (nom. inval.)]|nr:hypothetical protein MKEN_01236700 [Mycena kentingensis (nom. inval.)]
MSLVDPRGFIPHLIVWNTFNSFSAVANTFLLIITFVSHNANNLPLLNLEFIFLITSASASILAWSGHALDSHPPFGLCLWSAVVSMSDVPLMGGSAFAVVLKVWGSVVMATSPHWRRTVEWTTWTPFLLILPYASAIPMFLIALGIGLRNPNLVYRGSPFYCVVDHTERRIGIRRKLHVPGTRLLRLDPLELNYDALADAQNNRLPRHIVSVLRSLTFSVFVGIAFVVGIISLVSSFSAVVPDVALSSCNVAAFFIFFTS